MTPAPQNIELIGNELAVLWPDGKEDFFTAELLRKHSPSAENIGEKDLFGNQEGGSDQDDFFGVEVINWHYVGNYAIGIRFSDGHNSGIYSWKYLRQLSDSKK